MTTRGGRTSVHTGSSTPPPAADPLHGVDAPELPGRRRASWRYPQSWMLVVPVDAAMAMVPAIWAPEHLRAFICTAGLSCLLLTGLSRYRAPLHINVLDDIPFLLPRLFAAVAAVATVKGLRHEQEAVASFLVIAACSVALVVVGRLITMHIVAFGRRHRIVGHRTVLVGGGALSGELTGILDAHGEYGLDVIGYIDDDPATNPVPGLRLLGRIEDVNTIVAAHRVDTLLVAGATDGDEKLWDEIRRHPGAEFDLLVVPRLHQVHSQEGLADHIGAIPVMQIGKPSLHGVAWGIKRGFDIVAATVALLVLSPVLLACAVAVLCESGRPVFFGQTRVGGDGHVFTCWKFRSMRADSGESATRWSIAGDPRVGPVGRVLRRCSLDELPQLWNILRGDMTVVGPRPERPYFVDRFAADIPTYRYRHRVRGGLTGLAQVSGLRGDTPIVDRARFDNYYIEHWSLWLDAKIILRTVREVLFARGR